MPRKLDQMSGIPFTQYLIPDGRKRAQWIDRSAEVEVLAQSFIAAGGWYECEMLFDYVTVSLRACMNIDNQSHDIGYEIVENGPPVLDAVDRLVRKSATHVIFGAVKT